MNPLKTLIKDSTLLLIVLALAGCGDDAKINNGVTSVGNPPSETNPSVASLDWGDRLKGVSAVGLVSSAAGAGSDKLSLRKTSLNADQAEASSQPNRVFGIDSTGQGVELPTGQVVAQDIKGVKGGLLFIDQNNSIYFARIDGKVFKLSNDETTYNISSLSAYVGQDDQKNIYFSNGKVLSYATKDGRLESLPLNLESSRISEVSGNFASVYGKTLTRDVFQIVHLPTGQRVNSGGYIFGLDEFRVITGGSKGEILDIRDQSRKEIRLEDPSDRTWLSFTGFIRTNVGAIGLSSRGSKPGLFSINPNGVATSLLTNEVNEGIGSSEFDELSGNSDYFVLSNEKAVSWVKVGENRLNSLAKEINVLDLRVTKEYLVYRIEARDGSLKSALFDMSTQKEFPIDDLPGVLRRLEVVGE